MARIRDILEQQRKKNFVGRQKELEFFVQILEQKQPSHHLIYISGPGGQGKTTLLKQFTDQCNDRSLSYILLDARTIQANPTSFRQALLDASPWEKDLVGSIEAQPGTVVLLIDSYEKIKPLDDWLRMEFLPELPENVITVMTGRQVLATNWKTDPGWQSITKSFVLQELSDEESRQLLRRRNIPEEKIQRIVEFTHGHPLALSIVADMIDQRSDSHFDPLDSPDIMKTLLEQFVQEVPSPAHKAALELCSLVYITTEKLIEEVLGVQLAHELFNWLTTLTFIEKGPRGIYPHDIVRDAIIMELHWRNPDWYRHLHIRTQQFYVSRLIKQSGEGQRLLLVGLIFLHRTNPAVKPFLEFQETGSAWQDEYKQEDKEHLAAMVNKFEGKESEDNFLRWMDHPAAECWLYRDAEKTPAGFCLKINLHLLKEETHDPVISQLMNEVNNSKLQEGQLAIAFRTWMGRDHYQNISRIQSAIFLSMVQYYFTPGLALSFLSCAHPNFWSLVLSYADLKHPAQLDFEINKVKHGWFMHDWVERPPLQWLALMGRREINEPDAAVAQKTTELSEKDFENAVYEALKNIDSPKKLHNSPLLQYDFAKAAPELESSDLNKAISLCDKIKELVASLAESAKDATLHRVLYRTFINGVGSQEQTADFLYMSFSTYRRNLKKSVERIAELLWREK